jgi:hypothetical protein
MAKKELKQKRYSTEFKVGVIIDMVPSHLPVAPCIYAFFTAKKFISYLSNKTLEFFLKMRYNILAQKTANGFI